MQDYHKIVSYIENIPHRLVILDFNGVLDNQYSLKDALYRDMLGSRDDLLPELIVYTEKQYERNNSIKFEIIFDNPVIRK